LRLHPEPPIDADIVDRGGHDREFFWILSMSLWNSQKDRPLRPQTLGSTDHNAPMVDADIVDPSYLIADSDHVISSFCDAFNRRHPGADALNRMIFGKFRLRLPELLLMRADKIAMSVSLEARVPSSDHGRSAIMCLRI
jgi:asparagine synthase (glutamine-hydrolysing)